RRGFRFLGDLARLAGTFRNERMRAFLVPEPLGAQIGVLVVLLPFRVEPAPGVFAAASAKCPVDFPVVARRKSADALLTFDENRERGRLNTAHRRELKAARARIERG